ncbi:trypsin-like peptidase domain-containing protein [Georgenia sp. Z1344]|uniref:S1C family serine protease n=1 Tax=Georgenia sp. Z1344 TaxID=3416706 RepID=UPI003CF40277
MADERQFPAGPGRGDDAQHPDGRQGQDGPTQGGPYSRFAPPTDDGDEPGGRHAQGAPAGDPGPAQRPANPARPVGMPRDRADNGDGRWMPSGARQPMPSARPTGTGTHEVGGRPDSPMAGSPESGATRPFQGAPGESGPTPGGPGAAPGPYGQGAAGSAAPGPGATGPGAPAYTSPSNGSAAHGVPSAGAPGAGSSETTRPAGQPEAGPGGGSSSSFSGSAGPTAAGVGAAAAGSGSPASAAGAAHQPGHGFAAPVGSPGQPDRSGSSFGGFGSPSAPGSGFGGGSGAGPGSGFGAGSGAAGGSGYGADRSASAGDGGGSGRSQRRGVAVPVVALITAVALLAGLVLGALGGRWLLWDESSAVIGEDDSEESDPPESASGAVGVDRPDASVAQISDIALASTVYIEARNGQVGGSGTGMIYSEDGLIVTNNHVVEPALDGGQLTVTFHDGTQEEAELVGRSPGYDLAVLQVPREGLTPLVLADSDEVVVGDLVIAVGAPLGLTGTVTAGIISARNRPVTAGDPGDESYINALQTDAAINPGNSGGPLLNYDGEVVGINSVIYSSGEGGAGSIGLGFAIPANQVETTVGQLIEDGTASFAQIGISLDPSYFGEGVRVVEDEDGVVPDGPGDDAGIEPGDIITAFDGTPVTEPSEVIVFVRSHQGGDVVTLTIERDGEEQEVDVTLAEVEEPL